MRGNFLRGSLLGLALLLGTPGASMAYTLGEITVTSNIGENFYAELPLKLAPEEQTKNIVPKVASFDEYMVLELHRANVVAAIKSEVVKDERGARIVFKSELPINEPFFNLLLKTVHGSGSHYRNYPVLLNLPGEAPKLAQPAPTTERNLAAPPKPATAPQPVEIATPVVSNFQGGEYGPVKPGDTLYRIAKRYAGQAGVKESRMMVAIWSKNQDKFIRNNMNSLPVGVVLSIPDRDEVIAIPEEEAAAIRSEQRRAWLEGAGVKYAEGSMPAPPLTSDKVDVETKAKQKEFAQNLIMGEAAKAVPGDQAPQPGPDSTATPTLVAQTPPTPPKEEEPAAAQPTSTHPTPTADPATQPAAGEGTTPAAPPVTELTAAAPPATSDASDDATAPATSGLQLSDDLESANYKKLEAELATTSQKLQQAADQLKSANQAKLKLQSELTRLKQELSAQQEESGLPLPSEDLMLMGGGVVAVGGIAGVLAMLARRRRKATPLPQAAGVEPTLGDHHSLSQKSGQAEQSNRGRPAVGEATLAIDPNHDDFDSDQLLQQALEMHRTAPQAAPAEEEEYGGLSFEDVTISPSNASSEFQNEMMDIGDYEEEENDNSFLNRLSLDKTPSPRRSTKEMIPELGDDRDLDGVPSMDELDREFSSSLPMARSEQENEAVELAIDGEVDLSFLEFPGSDNDLESGARGLAEVDLTNFSDDTELVASEDGARFSGDQEIDLARFSVDEEYDEENHLVNRASSALDDEDDTALIELPEDDAGDVTGFELGTNGDDLADSELVELGTEYTELGVEIEEELPDITDSLALLGGDEDQIELMSGGEEEANGEAEPPAAQPARNAAEPSFPSEEDDTELLLELGAMGSEATTTRAAPPPPAPKVPELSLVNVDFPSLAKKEAPANKWGDGDFSMELSLDLDQDK